jgi:hypothetical protein
MSSSGTKVAIKRHSSEILKMCGDSRTPTAHYPIEEGLGAQLKCADQTAAGQGTLGPFNYGQIPAGCGECKYHIRPKFRCFSDRKLCQGRFGLRILVVGCTFAFGRGDGLGVGSYLNDGATDSTGGVSGWAPCRWAKRSGIQGERMASL